MAELDYSKIIQIESDTEIPISKSHTNTSRALGRAIPINNTVIDRVNVIDPKDIDIDLFTEPFEVIENLEKLKQELSKLLVVFDTTPEHYTKQDFFQLLKVISLSLLKMYSREVVDIINQWNPVSRKDAAPSEALVKGDLNIIDNNINNINTSIEDLSKELETLSKKKPEWGTIIGDIKDLKDLIDLLNEIKESSKKITDLLNSKIEEIQGKIPAEASKENLLADKASVDTNIKQLKEDLLPLIYAGL